MNNRHRKWKPILSLDFDGVLHSYDSGWQGARTIPDPPVKGAIRFLEKAITKFNVQIFSSRSNHLFGRRAMRRWLLHHATIYFAEQQDLNIAEHGTFYDDEHLVFLDEEAAKGLVSQIKFPLRKPPASVGIDDRVLTFTGEFPTMHELFKFSPWNKGK